MTTFTSVYSNRLNDYVTLRRGLGLQFCGQEAILREFDRFVRDHGSGAGLTQDLALQFAGAGAPVSEKRSAQRYQVVRHFSEYLATFEPETPRLDPRALRRPRTRPPAHIYTEDELSRLLQAARHVSPKHPIRGITLHAMVGLAASTGLRISEVARLDRVDVDLHSGVLTVRRAKFLKDRLVVAHPTTVAVLRDYAAVRDLAYPEPACPAFFVNMRRQRFAKHTLQMDFWRLARQIGIRRSTGNGPSFHDLRHSFAVRRLVSWYRAGVDVQAMLPALATYLGHAHYSDTAYYLTATAELLGVAAERFHRALQTTEVCS